MSTTTISFRFLADDVPTDADAVVLRDPSNGFGVRRLDTLAVVVAAGQAMTRQSAGVYAYTFTDPAPGLVYHYYVEATYGGATYRFERNKSGPQASGSAELRAAGLAVVVAPVGRPIDWTRAKAHLRLEGDEQQAYVEDLIDAATDFAEDRLASSLTARTLLGTFYAGERLTLRRGPLLEVVGVEGADGAAVTDYRLEHVGHEATLVAQAAVTYPVSVTYRAGHASAAAIPAGIRLAIAQHVATLFASRESVSDKARLPVPHGLEAFYALKSRKVCVA